MKKPIIGLNLDFEEKGKGYSRLPYHAVRENYLSPLYEKGATPILLPPTCMDIETYLDLVDGVLLTGGNDYDPTLFGGRNAPKFNLKIMHHRSKFDLDLIKGALDRNMPVLGICAGMQAINFCFGGTIYQDICSERPNSLNHMQKIEDVEKAAHDVEIQPNTLLSKIAKEAKSIPTNSFHHQAIKGLGEGLIASGHTSDGIIEALEHPSYKFCLGVEWHPEYKVSPADDHLFKVFVDACR